MIDAEYVQRVLRDLVARNSVNPTLVDGAPGEAEVADYVARALEEIGAEVTTYAESPDRPSVVGRLHGTGSGSSLMLYAHLDTVGVEGLERPFAAETRDGRLSGRGAYDMKGGLAACLGAAEELARDGRPAGDVLVVAVADEEAESIGMREVLRHASADGAIVTEPTEMQLCVAHKGFAWIEVVTHGRAAHGSRFDLGIDANMHMGRVLAGLGDLERRLRDTEPHSLVGPPSLHAAQLDGGSGPSTYAERCRLVIERRTVPGETEEQVLAEIAEILHKLSETDPRFTGDLRALLWRDAFEVSRDARIVTTVIDAAAEVLGVSLAPTGQTPWMDAAFLQAAGIETVVIGPAGAGAHGREEWVDVTSVERLATLLAASVRRFCV